MDRLTKDQRSANMAKIRAKNTKPEMAVRRTLHAMGYRFRIHAAELPGKPDIVFPRRKIALFVHGCFWHQHDNCKHAVLPKTRPEFWLPKLARNKSRDLENIEKLQGMGWRSVIIWECEVAVQCALETSLREMLGKPKYSG